MNYAEKKSVAELFKVITADDLIPQDDQETYYTLEKCLREGFVVVAEDHVVEQIPETTFCLLDQAIGTNVKLFNTTFHKSFNTVANMNPEEYYFQQMVHYLTTYGAKYYGYDVNPYIPIEDMDLPEANVSVKGLVVISVITEVDVKYLINSLAQKVQSTSTKMKALLEPLLHYIIVPLDNIKSFELMVMVAESNNVVPESPISFLRYLVYKTTGSTLLIKSNDSISSIKYALTYRDFNPTDLFEQADLKKLSSIFFRYKPIFLAYKTCRGCRPYINKLRRLADRYHKPLSEISVQNISKLVRDNRMNDVVKLIRTASNRDLVKLRNFFASKTEPAPAAYKVRNGKVYVDATAAEDTGLSLYNCAYMRNLAQEELINRLTPLYKGITFIIPEYIGYVVPTTEKQLCGNISWGTTIKSISDTFTAGITWNNGPNGEQTDLDLHLNSPTMHFGWNGCYSEGVEVIYTGDMTDARNGAAEAYWFKSSETPYILSVSRFSGPVTTPFKMFMTEVQPQARTRRYTFDPSTAMFDPIPLAFEAGIGGLNLGLFHEGIFYFYGGSLTSGCVPRGNYEDYIKAILNDVQSRWSLINLLQGCGAIVATERTDEMEKVIDLTPTALTSTSLLDVVDGNLP